NQIQEENEMSNVYRDLEMHSIDDSFELVQTVRHLRALDDNGELNRRQVEALARLSKLAVRLAEDYHAESVGDDVERATEGMPYGLLAPVNRGLDVWAEQRFGEDLPGPVGNRHVDWFEVAADLSVLAATDVDG